MMIRKNRDIAAAPSALRLEVSLYHGLTAVAIFCLFEALLWGHIRFPEGPKAGIE
jgi:hypothetical protein